MQLRAKIQSTYPREQSLHHALRLCQVGGTEQAQVIEDVVEVVETLIVARILKQTVHVNTRFVGKGTVADEALVPGDLFPRCSGDETGQADETGKLDAHGQTVFWSKFWSP
jgi:hypothetical protein